MKKLLLTGIAALFLATGTAHAYVHREFYRCGKYLVTNGNDMIRDHWSLLVEATESGKCARCHAVFSEKLIPTCIIAVAQSRIIAE